MTSKKDFHKVSQIQIVTVLNIFEPNLFVALFLLMNAKTNLTSR